MVQFKSWLIRAGLLALRHSCAARAAQPWSAGKGALLMLHRVQPGPAPTFAPNARLSVSPEDLRALLASFRAANLDVISLDEALNRLRCRKRARRFVCFTFDDGYRDNLEHALPVFRRFRAPLTVFATAGFADRSHAPWWVALERVIARERALHWSEAGASRWFDVRSLAAKRRVFSLLSARFQRMTAAELSPRLDHLLTVHGLSVEEVAARETCSWAELRALHDAGVEIGCHALSHPCLSRESDSVVRAELSSARRRIEAQLGRGVRHLSYPYGKREHVGMREFVIARELGFASAVTTRAGCLFAAHAVQRHALPRIELTPNLAASPHHVHTVLTGLPLVIRNRGRWLVTD